MVRRSFVLSLGMGLLLLPLRVAAQSGVSAISGTWAGELTPQGAPRSRAVTLELVGGSDGKVSGTMTGMPNPADVKTGSFNAKTGALKLEWGIKGESAVLIVFEGSVAKGVATGTITTGDGGGTFKVSKK